MSRKSQKNSESGISVFFRNLIHSENALHCTNKLVLECQSIPLNSRKKCSPREISERECVEQFRCCWDGKPNENGSCFRSGICICFTLHVNFFRYLLVFYPMLFFKKEIFLA